MSARRAGRHIVLLALLLGTTTGAARAGAQETESGNAPEEQEEQHSVDPQSEPSDNAESSPEVFVPSEEISEDFAVPFPVDI